MSALELCLFNIVSNGDVGKNIRGGISETTKEEIWAIFDFINAVCGKELNDNYGRLAYLRLRLNFTAKVTQNHRTWSTKYPSDDPKWSVVLAQFIGWQSC